MQAQGTEAVVVNTSSYAGLLNGSRIGFGSGLPYAASKHAVTLISENLAEELRSTAGCLVTAHVLCPAGVSTSIVDNAVAGAKENGLTMDELQKKPGAFGILQTGITPIQMVNVLYEGLSEGKFYILGHDNSRGGSKESMKALIQVRMEDILEERPAFSWLHPDKDVREPARAVIRAAAPPRSRASRL